MINMDHSLNLLFEEEQIVLNFRSGSKAIARITTE